MIYNGALLKIDGQTIPSITSYKVGRNKLWKDADRNMNGDIRATLIGIFPKIEINIGYTNQTEMAQICALLDKSYFDVTYFDVRSQGTTTAKYYSADYTPELSSKRKGLYQPMSVSLVPVSKRSY